MHTNANFTPRIARFIVNADKRNTFLNTNGDSTDTTLTWHADGTISYDGGSPGMYGQIVLITTDDGATFVALKMPRAAGTCETIISARPVNPRAYGSIASGIATIWAQM